LIRDPMVIAERDRKELEEFIPSGWACERDERGRCERFLKNNGAFGVGHCPQECHFDG